jgi:predicted  nucleic acid-binding Zn-ribbon protein
MADITEGTGVGKATIQISVDSAGVKTGVGLIRKELAALRADAAKLRDKLSQPLISGQAAASAANHLRSVERQIQSYDRTLRTATGTGRKFNSGLRQIRSGLFQTTIITLGTKSAFGQIAQGLFLLGPGEGAAIAAAAGLAAIGAAFVFLGKKAKEARKELQTTRKSIQEAFKSQFDADFKLKEQKREVELAQIRVGKRLLEARQELDSYSKSATSLTQPNFAGTAILAVAAQKEVDRLSKEYNELGKDIIRVDAILADNTKTVERAGRAAKQAASNFSEYTKAITDPIDALLSVNEQGKQWLQTLKIQLVALRDGGEAGQAMANSLRLQALGMKGLSDETRNAIEHLLRLIEITPRFIDLNEIGAAGIKTLKDFFRGLEQQAQARRDKFQQIGERIGQDLVRGLVNAIFEGTITVGEALKRMLLAAAVSALGQFIGGAIGGVLAGVFSRGAAPAAGAAGGSRGFGTSLGRLPSTAGLTAASGPTLAFNVSAIPANINPISAARDRQWLALVSETQRVAPSLGIRMVLQ